MARTINGNPTGRAARMTLDERLDMYGKTEFMEQFTSAVCRLREIDPDFEAWYDGRPEQTKGEMLPAMEARITEFETERECRRKMPAWIISQDVSHVR